MKNVDKFLIAIVAAVIILVIGALGVAFYLPEATYQPEDTPEGVVHNYLLAMENEDFERAYGYLSPSLDDYPEDADEFEDDLRYYGYYYNSTTSRTLAIENSKVNGSRATVTVRLTEFYGDGLFNSSEYSYTFEVTLQQEAGEWKIINSTNFFADCWARREGCSRP